MHRFRCGQFAELSVEQAMLRDAPALYEIVKWARREKIERLGGMIQDFEQLRRKSFRALITAQCTETGCTLPVHSMTLPVDREGWCRPSPYYWCDGHKPWERSGVSEKLAIHFDAITRMKTRREKELMFKELRIAIGIAPRTRITECFARNFFAALD